jgi:hypothetical protein
MTKPPYTPRPSFRSLYDAYTGPDSIGLHLTRHMVELTRHDPLLVVTGSDYVLFPGSGQRPIVEGFRNSTRGFVELTAISHLGPAVAWIFRLRELGYAGWRADAERLIERTVRVRDSTPRPTGPMKSRSRRGGDTNRRSWIWLITVATSRSRFCRDAWPMKAG